MDPLYTNTCLLSGVKTVKRRRPEEAPRSRGGETESSDSPCKPLMSFQQTAEDRIPVSVRGARLQTWSLALATGTGGGTDDHEEEDDEDDSC